MDLCITVAKYVAMTTSIQPFCYPSIQRCIHPSIKLYTHPIDYSTIIHASDWLFIHPSIHPIDCSSIHQFDNPSIHSTIHQFNYWSNKPCPYFHSTIHPSVWLSIHHPCIQSTSHPSIHLIWPSIRLFIYSSIYPLNYWSLRPCPFIHSTIHLYIRPSVRQTMHARIYPTIHPHDNPSICLSIQPSLHPFDHASIHSNLHPSDHPFIYPFTAATAERNSVSEASLNIPLLLLCNSPSMPICPSLCSKL